MDQREKAQEASDSDFVQVLCLEEEIAALEQNIITAKEKLEHLESELALVEQKKKETENQILTMMKDGEKKDQEFREKIMLLTEQKNSLERQCGDLSDRYRQQSDDLNQITKTLQDKNGELKKVKAELAAARRELKWIFRKRRLALGSAVAAVIGLMAIICFGWVYFNNEISYWEDLYRDGKAEREEYLVKLSELESAGQNTNTEKEEALAKLSTLERTYQDTKKEGEEALAKITELEGLYQDTKTEKEEALAKLSEMEAYAAPAMIKVNSVYNAREGGPKISDDLKSSEMRYLMFDFNVYLLEDDKGAMIYLDIYKPDGTLFRSSSNSPSGHTTSFEVKGENKKLGWGNSSESAYSAGIYRVDFVYKGVIIHSQKVEIKSSTIKLS